MNKTEIAWTDVTWNPWSGCEKISPGCANCYAEGRAERFRGRGPAFPNGFELTYRPHKLTEPLKMKTPQAIFVNSMSDLFLEAVPDSKIVEVFDVMNKAHWHVFQVLTKRSERLREMAPHLKWTPNIWQGVSVENQYWTRRIPDLLTVPSRVRFLSVEPLLGPVDIRPWLAELQWVIVGGESGRNLRPMNLDWARAVRDQTINAKVPFFYKQGNGWRSGMNKVLDGREWQERPGPA